MFKNVASQKIAVFAYDITTGGAKTGDSANITVYVDKDWAGVNALTDTSATELSSTNAAGWYIFDVTQTESNADALLFTGKSSTANIQIAGQLIFTDPPNYTTLSVDSNGRVDVIKIAGTTQTAGDVGAKTGFGLSSSERNSTADAILDRDMSTGTDSGSTTVRTVRQALRALRNKFTISAGTYTVYKEDDTASSWTSTVTTDASANPVTASDPAG